MSVLIGKTPEIVVELLVLWQTLGNFKSTAGMLKAILFVSIGGCTPEARDGDVPLVASRAVCRWQTIVFFDV